jgi:hypothetical protein
MAALIKWKEPRSVSNWQLKHETVPEFMNLSRLFWKWSLILGIPVLVATWYWLPQSMLQMLAGLGLCCAVPAGFFFTMWLCNKAGTFCSVHKNGMAKFSGNTGKWYDWREIESYRFDDFPHVENVRRLILKLHRGQRRFERSFHFSPAEVSEDGLRTLLQEYLPERL